MGFNTYGAIGGYISFPKSSYCEKKYAEAIAEFIAEAKGLTEAKLIEIIDERKRLGDLAERLAHDWEVTRLKENGHIVESHCVKLISKLKVDAGYDIQSFNGKAQGMRFDRYIEVKGSKGPGIRFFWSDNEINVAKKLGNKYWIYYIGGIDVKKKEANIEPILYQNPIITLEKDSRLTTRGNGMVVQGTVPSPNGKLTLIE